MLQHRWIQSFTQLLIFQVVSVNNFRFMEVCLKKVQKLRSLCQQGLHVVCLFVLVFLIPEDNINKLKYFAMGFLIKWCHPFWEPQGYIKPQSKNFLITDYWRQCTKTLRKTIFVEDWGIIQNHLMKILVPLTTSWCKPVDECMPNHNGLDSFL